MPKVAITKSKLDALAAKIATKSGATLPLTLDEMEDAVDDISGGGTDFIVNLTYNSSTDMWVPDCTIAELQAAYSAGKTIYVTSDNTDCPASGSYDDGDNALYYFVFWFDYGADKYFTQYFIFDSNGVADDGKGELMVPPTATKSITANGTGIDVLNYASVDVAVPSAAPTLETVEHVQPTETNQTITPQSGFDGLASVQIDGISSNYVGSGITRRSSSDLTASGATVTVPAGYYSSQASKAVASGTEGTPTATKGTVSNNSVTVTPSVTNTAGYISGGTKTGTGVSVSASELVSGTLNVTSSGTKDVTNYASASIPAGTVTAPSSISGTTATVSTGTNTLTLTKTVSVTPNVTTAGYISSGTAGNASISLQASVTTQAAQTIHPSTSNQTIAASRYLTGTQTINAVTHNLDASKILSGTTFKIGDSADDDCVASVAGTLTFQTIYSGSSAPSSSTGVNGDIYIQT